MAAENTESLVSRLQDVARAESQPVDALVPVEDFALFYLTASEIARTAVSDGGERLLLFVDSQTAMQVDAVDGARAAADRVVVYGPSPDAWAGCENVLTSSYSDAIGENDLFVVVISSRLNLGLVCEQGPAGFHGFWSPQRDHTVKIAQYVLEQAGLSAAVELPEADEGAGDTTLACSTRLMALLARQLTLRHRDVAMDKDDLFSVLSILKAVSAERRAHDILYVFVEQIARAVRMDRCSVVRVWGGDQRGHVLASHEDESITDLVIDLRKYPELRRSMETRQKVIINDTRRDPLTRPFFQDIAKADIQSVIVIPVVLFDQNVGSFLLRAARKKGTFSLREISFCEIVAEAAANALERAHLFESIQKANERLEVLAITDGLTGLYNHRYFRQRLEEEFERARRYSLPLSCMILDVDDFKSFNDTYGHLLGDAVLRGVAACTLQTTRKSDIVARCGGEEFVVIMPQTGLEGATAEAERVRKEICHWPFEGVPNPSAVAVSIGVAVFDRESMPDCEALLCVADGALYRAKKEGKNRVVVG